MSTASTRTKNPFSRQRDRDRALAYGPLLRAYQEQKAGLTNALRNTPLNPIPEQFRGIKNIMKSLKFGVPVGSTTLRRNDVAPDLQGKILGYGTFPNSQTQAFKTKESALLESEWARALNEYLAASLDQLGSSLQSVPAQYRSLISLGLWGVNGDGSVYPYMNGIDRYYPDVKARFTFTPENLIAQRVQPYVLPGSTESILANDSGYGIGLVLVRNPTSGIGRKSKVGYVRPGSKGWIKALQNGVVSNSASGADLQHLFGQGVYTLGPVYSQFGIEVEAIPPQGPTGSVRFSVPRLNDYIKNGEFMDNVEAYYKTYLASADQSRIGTEGAKDLFLRHADKVRVIGDQTNYGNTEEGRRARIQAVNTAAQRAWQSKGSIKDVLKWDSVNGVNYNDPKNRFGISAFPLRDASGFPIPAAQATIKNGRCGPYGSGVGVSQSANPRSGFYNDRFYKMVRHHANGKDTLHCGATPDNVQNLNRKVYKAGGARATKDKSLAKVIDDYGNPMFSSDDLQGRYNAWARSPESEAAKWYTYKGQGSLGFNPEGQRRLANVLAQAGQPPNVVQQVRGGNLSQMEAARRSATQAAAALSVMQDLGKA